jgi:hypothetical protein
MAIFLIVAGIVLILIARRIGKRRREAKLIERATLRALRKARAEEGR